MTNRYKYTSINRILDKLRRDLDMDDIQETDVIEWTGEALEGIGAVTQYEQAIAFIEVNNYTALLPNGLHNIIQLARNRCWTGTKEDPLCPIKVSEEITSSEDEVIVPVALNCNGTPINDYELAYYRPYFDLQTDYGTWTSSNLYQNCYTPIRLTNHSFFDSLVCNLDDKIYENCVDQYNVVSKGLALRFSFQEGSVALSYTRQVLDEDGYPMIPDHYSYVTAITKYITYKLMERRFYRNERGSESRLQKAESDWHWYAKQAGNNALMLKGVDDHQDLLDQREYLLPPRKRYYGFFGKLNRPESRNFNDPDFRNNNMFRGYGRQV